MFTVEICADDRRTNSAPFAREYREYYHQPASLIYTMNKLEMYVNAGLGMVGVIIKKKKERELHDDKFPKKES